MAIRSSRYRDWVLQMDSEKQSPVRGSGDGSRGEVLSGVFGSTVVPLNIPDQ